MKGDPLRKGRLGGERPQEVMEFLSSMGADRWIGRADLIVDIAHLLMLEKQEIIDREAAVAVMKALLAMVDEGLPESVYDDRYEDIHAGIEANLIDSVGMDFGGRLHMGRSRNDEVATCIRLSLRREMLSRMSEINSLRQVLLDLASVHTQSVMPGFTHLQHAQPTTLAHYMLSYEQAFSRDFDRFRDTYARVNLCPLGAAAFASTGYPIDREYTADLLGFDGLVKNSMDAVSARDFALEVISDCTIIMSTVSRLCEELVVWSSGFVKFVDLND
ncbi:MAG: argininosuccinate lyase, partial [Methanogenium sp.]|nr:argininosuccinate lyase [Methanogenium sp.]